MSDFQKSMETIFCEAAKALGQLASQKLINETFKEAEIKPVGKKAAAKEKAPAENTTEPRWSRWTKTYTDSFKKSLTDVGLNADDKEFEKLKKEFVKYINELTEEDYKKDTKTHTDRMNDFAAIKAPPKQQEEQPAKRKTLWEEMNSHETPNAPPSNAAAIHVAEDIEELQNNEFLVEVKGSPDGVYWDGKNGRWIQGPRPVDNEDVVEVKFNGVTYAVGEQSLIVYLETDNRDIFQGYCGIGKFKDMKLP